MRRDNIRLRSLVSAVDAYRFPSAFCGPCRGRGVTGTGCLYFTEYKMVDGSNYIKAGFTGSADSMRHMANQDVAKRLGSSLLSITSLSTVGFSFRASANDAERLFLALFSPEITHGKEVFLLDLERYEIWVNWFQSVSVRGGFTSLRAFLDANPFPDDGEFMRHEQESILLKEKLAKEKERLKKFFENRDQDEREYEELRRVNRRG